MTIGQSKKMEEVNVSYQGLDIPKIEKKLQESAEFAVSKDSNKNAEEFLTLLKGKEYAVNNRKEIGVPNLDDLLADKKEEKEKMIRFREEQYSLEKERVENLKKSASQLFEIAHSKFLELSNKYPGLITDGFLVDLKVGEQRYESIFLQLSTLVNFSHQRSLDLLRSIEVETIPLELLSKMNSTQEEVQEEMSKKYNILEEKVILKLSNVVMSIPSGKEEVPEEEVYKIREEMIGCMFGKKEKDYRQSRNLKWEEESKKEVNYEKDKSNFGLKIQDSLKNLTLKLQNNDVREFKDKDFDEYLDLLYEVEDIKKISVNNYYVSDFIEMITQSFELENLLKKNLYNIAENLKKVGNLKVFDSTISQLKKLGVNEPRFSTH